MCGTGEAAVSRSIAMRLVEEVQGLGRADGGGDQPASSGVARLKIFPCHIYGFPCIISGDGPCDCPRSRVRNWLREMRRFWIQSASNQEKVKPGKECPGWRSRGFRRSRNNRDSGSDYSASDPGRIALQNQEGFVIPAEGSSAREIVELSLHYHHDVTLMEASLPGLDGLTAAQHIRDEAPEVRVVIFSQHDAEETQFEALRAGACGFLSKNVPLDTVARVLRGVVSGESAFSRKVTMRLIEHLRELPEAGPADVALCTVR